MCKAILDKYTAYIASKIYALHWRMVQWGAFSFKYKLKGKIETLQAQLSC